jgi:hypothetical protein
LAVRAPFTRGLHGIRSNRRIYETTLLQAQAIGVTQGIVTPAVRVACAFRQPHPRPARLKWLRGALEAAVLRAG